MYTGILHFHSLNKWVVLILAILSLSNALMGWLGKKPYTGTSNKLSLYFMISMHVQFLLGLALFFFLSPIIQAALSNMGAAMKEAPMRYWAVEHSFAGIFAIVMVTLGRVLAKKKSTDMAKHKTTVIFYLITLIFIAVNILFPLKFGRNLLPF